MANLLHPPLPPGWNNQVTEPCYMWNNGPEQVRFSSGAGTIRAGEHFFHDTPMPGYTPYTYPHPLVTGTGTPTPTPIGSPTPTPSATSTPFPSPTSTATGTPTATPTPTRPPPTPTPTTTPTATPTATPTPTPTPTPTLTPTATPTPTSTPTPTPIPSPTPPVGLLAAYNFNEGSGTIVTDASGHGITGTVHRTAWTAGGRYGNALSFNGSSSYVDLGNPALLQITGSMTWSAWAKAAGNPADDGQIVAKSNNTSGWQLKTSPDTGPQSFGVAVARANNTSAQRYSTTVRSLNVWYHVAGVYNAAARTLDIYVNGVLADGALSGTVPAKLVNNSVNVNIGR